MQTLSQQLYSLVELHQQLWEVSTHKTELIKENKVDELSKVLMNERRLVQTIEQTEQEREQTTKKVYQDLQLPTDDLSLVVLVEHLENKVDKAMLLEAMTTLIEIMTKLKENEALNKALLEQSMQFVQLSLSMYEPSMDSLNYGKKQQEKQTGNRSVFDSKA